MKSFGQNDHAFTGLEAAIVLIAFVVVAAVFSYVVLGAGFFTTQKSQETVYKGVEQATANIQVIGNVYGISTSNSTVGTTNVGIGKVRFTIGLAPGAPSVDLSKMTIVYTNETNGPRVLPFADSNGIPAQGYFSANLSGAGTQTMAAQDQVVIEFLIPGSSVGSASVPGKNTVVQMELRPSVGASLPFTRTLPATINTVNILY